MELRALRKESSVICCIRQYYCDTVTLGVTKQARFEQTSLKALTITSGRTLTFSMVQHPSYMKCTDVKHEMTIQKAQIKFPEIQFR